ncbi:MULTISPECIES: hypothetical protein [unclassified Nocardioides]|uniref:hypothetical protein n=1 Tax=unclassified Nocardioides TaxID=2615069 RepID=UPI0009F0759C|nr:MULTISPECIES: hypothetical protein [unclassified Nocardioides]GAW50974.1 uncharacterized protein PD653B2_3310 [Nocardioides sp. PD653-B2]GAW56299.1 uncharacterized protein PD653_3735 [Nocardioides sp. PD653]
MSSAVVTRPAPSPPPARVPAARWRGVAVVALAAALLWLPNLLRPLSSDEGGFLLVASQWSPGTSLYGNYWVDRPPLLIGLFQLADEGGGRTGLRLLGLLAVVVSVLLAGRIGRLAAPHTSAAPVLVAATSAVFVTAPLFGASEVDGELLAVPWVLGGMLCVLEALGSAPRRRKRLRWAAAGAAAMAAALVKQSMVEVLVLAAVVIAWLVVRRRYADAGEAAAAFSLGAVALLGTVLVWAAVHGTDPAGLWDAVVVFRAEAAATISHESSPATSHRAAGLVASFLASGALVVPAVAFLPGVRRRGVLGARDRALPDVRLLAGAVLAWELVGVALGGSYWLHYLIGTVPGLVLVAAALAAHRPARTRWVVAALTYGTAVSLVATAGLAVHDRDVPPDAAVAAYLVAHEHPGDTGVVGFGNPAILENAHLTSPYPELWSLPVRVRDPHLAELTRILESSDRPSWVVVDGTSLATWGVDATAADPVLEREYQWVDTEGDLRIYRRRMPPGAG